ncbi:RND family transporter [Psychrobium sp. 1_MG-2023]|uniref:efflux RND transporter permease subunit n=1 Tax=Psychrobium sp. 1_MG-2023 TaxID=3062624 RepID=UPI002736A2F1|nr:MMPL family transporter [Psychrobium sp. 1_MG-2023]MDP2560202.1 MMPL family transporter [Psychrobium sp. 1_MG-2023]
MSIIVIALLSQIPRMTIDTDPENMLSKDDPARLYHQQIKQQFLLHDAMVLGVVHHESIFNIESLTIINSLTDFIVSLDDVVANEVIAPTTVDNITNQGQGTLAFSWLMAQVPNTEQEAVAIGAAIQRLPLLNNTLVSGDKHAIAIYVPLVNKTVSYEVAEQIRSFIDTLPQSHNYYITGLPIAEDQFGSEMFVQMAISAPLAGLMIFVIMWWFFRQVKLVMGAMIVAMATVVITMGLLVTFGYSVHILSSMIAIFLMPIAVVDSIHILSAFNDKLKQSHKAAINQQQIKQLIREVIDELFEPMLFTTCTSAIGFLSLMLTPIPPVQIFGAFVGFGIFAAFILTMTVLPAYLSRIPIATIEQVISCKHRTNKLDHVLVKMPQLTTRNTKSILAIFIVIAIISVIGIERISINDNPVRWFKSDHEVSIADRTLNKHFSGTYNAYLILDIEQSVHTKATYASSIDLLNVALDKAQQRAHNLSLSLPKINQDLLLAQQSIPHILTQWSDDVEQMLFDLDLTTQQQEFLEQVTEELTHQFTKDDLHFYQPQLLSRIELLMEHLRLQPQVGKVNGLTDIIKTVNRELISGDDADFTMPISSDGVAQVLMQYQSSHRPQDLSHFVTPDKRSTLLWLQLSSGDNQTMEQVLQATNNYLSQSPLPNGVSVNWAGKAYINYIWQQQMVAGMLESLISAFVIVFIMMVLLFRSFSYGVLAMLPLTLTIAAIYGVIGWTGKDYDMPIAVLSSLTLGLSVDFAIHFIERFRSLRKQGQTIAAAIEAMYQEPARAISRNASVIALGFTPLLFAPLVPYVTVGAFLASIMVLSAIATLILLPTLIKTLNLNH